MKNPLRLMTIFMGIIGACAAFLVVFILAVYPNLNHNVQNKNVESSSAVTFIAPENSSIGPEQSEGSLSPEYIETASISSETESGTEPIKSGIYDIEDISIHSDQVPPASDSESDFSTEPSETKSIDSSSTAPVISADESLTDTNVPDSTVIENSVQTTGSQGTSGDGNNFNTYDNPEQQQTSASYVLNTSRMKIHYPSCSSVKKIAPQNYATTNSSIEDLRAQGYKTCGNCFK